MESAKTRQKRKPKGEPLTTLNHIRVDWYNFFK